MCAWDGFDSRNYKTYFFKKRESKRERERGEQGRPDWSKLGTDGGCNGFQWCPTTNVASIIPLQETRVYFLKLQNFQKMKILGSVYGLDQQFTLQHHVSQSDGHWSVKCLGTWRRPHFSLPAQECCREITNFDITLGTTYLTTTHQSPKDNFGHGPGKEHTVQWTLACLELWPSSSMHSIQTYC